MEESQDPFAALGLAPEALDDGDDGAGVGGQQRSSVTTVDAGRDVDFAGGDDEQDGLSPADKEEVGRAVSMLEPLLGL
jgi:hypothetical protein